MNVVVEAQHIELSPEWKESINEKLSALNDPRDPIVSVRATFSYNEGEVPPAEVKLVMGMRGKSLVAHKRGDACDSAMKMALDTAKREIRKYYEVRSDHRNDVGVKDLEALPSETLDFT